MHCELSLVLKMMAVSAYDKTVTLLKIWVSVPFRKNFFVPGVQIELTSLSCAFRDMGRCLPISSVKVVFSVFCLRLVIDNVEYWID